MGEIRSAIDIALEKAADIQGNPLGTQNRTIKNKGIKAAATLVADGDVQLFLQEMKDLSPADTEAFCSGAYSVLFAAIKLPITIQDMQKYTNAAHGFETLCADPSLPPFMQQGEMIFNQYLQEKDQLKQMLAQQYSPKLRQKEQELARVYGQGIHLEPEQDPEFADLLRKQTTQMSIRYEAAIKELHSRLSVMTGYEW